MKQNFVTLTFEEVGMGKKYVYYLIKNLGKRYCPSMADTTPSLMFAFILFRQKMQSHKKK